MNRRPAHYVARHRGETPDSWVTFDGLAIGSVVAFLGALGIIHWLQGIS